MPEDITPPPLPGEAPTGTFRPLNANGEAVNPTEVIFPILRQEADSRFRLIGTGFFITDNGLFATAKHVLLDVIDEDGNQTAPIGLMQFLPGDQFILRRILRCVSHEIADVAVGVAATVNKNSTGEPFKNKILTLAIKHPTFGTPVGTYAYPKTIIRGLQPQKLHFYPTFFQGLTQDYFPSGRDKVLMPGPCFHTTINVHGGASGGPVFGDDGVTFGINSTGCEGENWSAASRIEDLLSLRLPNVTTPRITSGNGVSLRELAEEGFIIVHGPTSPPCH